MKIIISCLAMASILVIVLWFEVSPVGSSSNIFYIDSGQNLGDSGSLDVALGDLDLDGDLDAFVANWLLDANRVWLNNGVGEFYESSQIMENPNSLKVELGDLDNDGDLDLLVLNLNDRPRLLRNDIGNRSHWLELRLVGTASNRDAVGARVRLTAGGHTQLRDVRTSSGYLSQSDPRLHFGLGSSAVVDHIEISWPSGTVQRLEKVAADRLLTVIEPRSTKGPE